MTIRCRALQEIQSDGEFRVYYIEEDIHTFFQRYRRDLDIEVLVFGRWMPAHHWLLNHPVRVYHTPALVQQSPR